MASNRYTIKKDGDKWKIIDRRDGHTVLDGLEAKSATSQCGQMNKEARRQG